MRGQDPRREFDDSDSASIPIVAVGPVDSCQDFVG